jgi:8-oxo-dGTP diphosphatase
MGTDKKIRIRVAVVLLKENKILLVQHQKKGRKYWLLPGGGLEYGETIAECAKRELREEANLHITPGDLILVSESIPPDDHRHVVNLYYRGEIDSGTLKKGDDHVISDIRFVPISELIGLDFFPNVKKELLYILENSEVTLPRSLGNRWE